jgi:hypothetical protein
MLPAKLVATLLLMTAAAVPGCLNCPENAWRLDWTQSNLYEKLPHNGTRGGYSFQNTTTHIEGQHTTPEGFVLTLTTEPNGHSQFIVYQKYPPTHLRPSDEQIHGWAHLLLQDLNAPTSLADASAVRGLVGSC